MFAKHRFIMDTYRGSSVAGARKPAGGFSFISGTALLVAWAAYRRGDLRLVDLRVWFACFEAVARRCGLKKGMQPKYRIEEIHALVGGVGGEHVRRSITRLCRTGVLQWAESAVSFPRMDSDALLGNDDDMADMLKLVANHRRLIPVPRRIVRLIAGGARQVVIATIAGHLLRCMYYRRGQCLPDGTCKASWVADVFGVNVRNVKMARKYLVRVGWLLPLETKQVHLNRWGQRMRVNLEWPGVGEGATAKRSPPRQLSTTELPPPNMNKKLPIGINNQKPAFRGPAGVPVGTGTGNEGKPTLRDVKTVDLKNDERLTQLFRQAVAMNQVSATQCDRLRFFAAAEHAMAMGTKNACGLFATVVRQGLWEYISLPEEDVAARRLKRWDECRGQFQTSRDCIGKGRDRRLESTRGAPHAAQAAATSKLDRAAIRDLVRQSLQSAAESDPPDTAAATTEGWLSDWGIPDTVGFGVAGPWR